MENNSLAEKMCDYYYNHFYKDYIVKNSEENMEKIIKRFEGDMDEVDNYMRTHKSSKGNSLYGYKKKNLKHFEKTIEMFSEREGFNIEDFLNSVMAEEFLFPTQLPVEKNWKIFERNIIEFKNKELLEKSDFQSLIERTKKFFITLNGRKIKDLWGNYFTKRDIENKYAEDELDLCVLCFSKDFMSFAKEENMFIDFKEEQDVIRQYPKLLKKIKEKLGEDFMEVK